jgi:peptidoglycan/LPS O-acetylase OafA/YrhL/lysophospholipase L1-like esterase
MAEFLIGAPPGPRPSRPPRRADRAVPTRRDDTPTATGHIHGLDGLRAVAVAMVVVFHIWPSLLPGGFLGVDVFFVVSGFLITTLLLRERRDRGRVDLRGFWRRRARRLLPALAFMCVITIVVAMAVNRDLLVDAGRQALGAATFSTNWLEIAAGTDYFAEREPILFNPLWSLAVEEQFYLLWPLTFSALAASTFTPRQLARMLRIVALASAALMALRYTPAAATRVYYGTDTHLFGLMIGCSLAYAFWDPTSRLASRRWLGLRRWVGFAATAALLALSVGLSDETSATYRGGILAASLCTAVMVAALPGPSSRYTRLLDTRPLRWIGERSYAIYLWHWPVLLIVVELLPRRAPGTTTDAGAALLTIATTLLLSEISLRWVETPIRTHGLRVLRPPAPTSTARRVGIPAVGGLVVAAALAAALVGIANAPDRSAAAESVESGLRMIERANAANSSVTVTTTTLPAEPTTVPDDTTATAPTVEPAWPRELATPPGELITGLGDSVLSGAAPAMYERFPGIRLEATPILQWHDAPGIVARLAAAGELRPVVVLNFGTNAGLVTQESRAAVREVLDTLGPQRRVILVTIVGVSHWVRESNETLAAISSEYPNTAIADWHAVVVDNPDLLHTDRTHPNMAGISVYADLIARTADALGPG